MVDRVAGMTDDIVGVADLMYISPTCGETSYIILLYFTLVL